MIKINQKTKKQTEEAFRLMGELNFEQHHVKSWLGNVMQEFDRRLKQGGDPSIEFCFFGAQLEIRLIEFQGVYTRKNQPFT